MSLARSAAWLACLALATGVATAAAAQSTMDYEGDLAVACQGENRGRTAGPDAGTITLTDSKMKIDSENSSETMTLDYFQTAKPWCVSASDAVKCLRKRQKGVVFKVIGAGVGVDGSDFRRNSLEDAIATFEGTLKFDVLSEPAKLQGTLILFDEETECIAQINLKARAERDGGIIDTPPPAPGLPPVPGTPPPSEPAPPSEPRG